jgi:hypothetical protein
MGVAVMTSMVAVVGAQLVLQHINELRQKKALEYQDLDDPTIHVKHLGEG